MNINLGAELWSLPNSKSLQKDKGTWVTNINFGGTKERIEELAEELAANDEADNIQITEGVTWRLSYVRTIPENSNQQNNDNLAVQNAVWEFDKEQIDNDIKACPTFAPIKKFFAEVDAAIENGNMDDGGQFDIQGYCDSQNPPITIQDYWAQKHNDPLLGDYYMMRINAVSNYPVFRLIIRQTINIDKRSRIIVRGVGIGEMPEVIPTSEIPIPNDVNIEVPDEYLWLVIPPTFSKNGNKKTIVYEWRGASKYSPTLYDGGNFEVWEEIA